MTIVCPYQDCQQQLAIEAHHAGSEANCPTCRRPMQLPELSAFPVEEADPAPWVRDEPAAAPPRQDAAELAPEDLVSNLISRSALGRQEPSPSLNPAPQDTRASRSDSPRDRLETPPPKSDADADSDSGVEPSTGFRMGAVPERPFTPGGGAGCPKCMHAFDDDAQEFVRELVELRETGIGVGKIGVKCACGIETEFANLLWIKSGEAAEPHPSSRKRVSRPAFHPPNSRRDRARIFSDAGFAAVKRGDPEVAHTKWLQATDADQSWSIPFFNLARLSLDQGDRHAAIAFLGMAEDRAQEGSSEDDAQVIKQVPFLRSRLEVTA